METSECAHHRVTPTPTELSGQLNCSLIRFGARVAEENLPGTTEKLVNQHCSFCCDGIRKKVADMHQCLCLVRNRFGDNRVTMPK